MNHGDSIRYVDEFGKAHNALVTADHQPSEKRPSVNLVYVSTEDSETDQYGRQIKRATSVVHKDNQGAHGRYWRELGA